MLNRAPSDCHHTATAFPDASTATCGLKAGPALSVSMRVAVPQPTPGTYRFAQMLNWTPSSAFHTATALPDGSAATWGDCAAPALSVSMSTAVPQPGSGSRAAAGGVTPMAATAIRATKTLRHSF